MKFTKWRNPYMDLVTTKPTYILPQEDDSFDTAALESLHKRISQYPSLVLEIGSGSGGHLIALAEREPDTFHLGFELRYKRVFRTAEKAELRGLQNLTVVRGDARMLSEILGGFKASGCYINFPDPWGKKSWKKHRIMSEEYLSLLYQHLSPEGFLSYKTDHQEYFRWTIELVERLPHFDVIEHTEHLHESPYIDSNITTEFESLFLSQGLPIYYLKALRGCQRTF